MGDSEEISTIASTLTAGPKRKVVVIGEGENGFVVQEQFYPRRQFIANNAERASTYARQALERAA